MTKIRVLNQRMVKEVLVPQETIHTVETVYRSKAQQNSTIWPMIFYEFEPGKADMDIKSGYMKELDIYGLKLVSWFGENPAKGLPVLYGTTMLFNSKTGTPLGLVDAEYITGMRTGAAGAIGSKWLARKDAANLLMVGTGHQALFQILMHIIAIPNLQKVRVSNPVHPEAAEKFVDSCSEKLLQLLQEGPLAETITYAEFAAKLKTIEFSAAPIKEAVLLSDIIVTATPARTPFIEADWVQPGTHISCIGADMSGKQEIDGRLFTSARVFVDDRQQAVAVGEIELPLKARYLKTEQIQEIGDLLIGAVAGRATDQEITIFDSTGIALQDLAVTKQILAAAQEKGIGQVVEL